MPVKASGVRFCGILNALTLGIAICDAPGANAQWAPSYAGGYIATPGNATGGSIPACKWEGPERNIVTLSYAGIQAKSMMFDWTATQVRHDEWRLAIVAHPPGREPEQLTGMLTDFSEGRMLLTVQSSIGTKKDFYLTKCVKLSVDDKSRFLSELVVYKIAAHCAEHQISFSEEEVNAIRDAIGAKLDKGGVTKPEREALWKIAEQSTKASGLKQLSYRALQRECQSVYETARFAYPQMLISGSPSKKSPF